MWASYALNMCHWFISTILRLFISDFLLIIGKTIGIFFTYAIMKVQSYSDSDESGISRVFYAHGLPDARLPDVRRHASTQFYLPQSEN